MTFDAQAQTIWKVISPNGIVLEFTSEADAKAKAKELNGPRFGSPARHWSNRWKVVAA